MSAVSTAGSGGCNGAAGGSGLEGGHRVARQPAGSTDHLKLACSANVAGQREAQGDSPEMQAAEALCC